MIYFDIGLIDKTDYVKFSINILNFTKQTNGAKYKQVLF